MSLTNLLQTVLHGAADVRQAMKAGASPPGQPGAPSSRGSKCTPCAAAAYVENARKTTQKKYGSS